MRIILKLFAAPFVLALTLAVVVLSFLFSLASWAFGVLSLLFAVCALFSIFIEGDTAWGIHGLVIAFCVSPFGLPAVTEWLIGKLDGLNYSLKCFITD
ncbi:CD1845 family protein [Intestinimonas butyriciproducens]|uniref:CD1845 family protein n=1 Tax=Intestinimonas butyriciproducens TaxID=1297617 RepID=UPI00242E920C|nr:CD1845 family protein [Intestinimonas butyriciproducens]